MTKKKILIKTPAKINLGLRVKELRPDGYHEIATTMQMVGLFDELTFETIEKGIEIVTEGEVIKNGEENIIYKAYKILMKETEDIGVRIRLKKNIPVASGLGGGSSDGAATLVGLNMLWGLNFNKKKLMHFGSRLGSDVPFFLFGPSAHAKGRGDILTPVKPLNAWVLLVKPSFAVSTSWAYNNYNRLREKEQDTKLLTKRRDSIKLPRFNKRFGEYINDLERVTGSKYPVISSIKKELIDSGAEISLMSGSGSTVFGIFSEKKSAEDASRRFKGYKVFVVKTLKELPY